MQTASLCQSKNFCLRRLYEFFPSREGYTQEGAIFKVYQSSQLTLFTFRATLAINFYLSVSHWTPMGIGARYGGALGFSVCALTCWTCVQLPLFPMLKNQYGYRHFNVCLINYFLMYNIQHMIGPSRCILEDPCLYNGDNTALGRSTVVLLCSELRGKRIFGISLIHPVKNR